MQPHCFCLDYRVSGLRRITKKWLGSVACVWGRRHNAWNVEILKTFELLAINAHLFLCSSCCGSLTKGANAGAGEQGGLHRRDQCWTAAPVGSWQLKSAVGLLWQGGRGGASSCVCGSRSGSCLCLCLCVTLSHFCASLTNAAVHMLRVPSCSLPHLHPHICIELYLLLVAAPPPPRPRRLAVNAYW